MHPERLIIDTNMWRFKFIKVLTESRYVVLTIKNKDCHLSVDSFIVFYIYAIIYLITQV